MGARLWLCGLSARQDRAEGTDHRDSSCLACWECLQPFPSSHGKSRAKYRQSCSGTGQAPSPQSGCPRLGLEGRARPQHGQGFVLNCHVCAEGQGLLRAGAALPPPAAGMAGVPGANAAAP